jgi:hypothetical protein
MKTIHNIEEALEESIAETSKATLSLTTNDEMTHDLKVMLHTLKAVACYLESDSLKIQLI